MSCNKHEAFVGVDIGIGIGIDQKALFPGINKPQRPFDHDPDSDTDPDTDSHGMHPNGYERYSNGNRRTWTLGRRTGQVPAGVISPSQARTAARCETAYGP